MKLKLMMMLVIMMIVPVLAHAEAFAQTPPKPLTNEDIVSLKAAGLNDETIILKVQSGSQLNFRLDPADIVALKGSNISDGIISAMLKSDSMGTKSAPKKARLFVYRYKQYVGSALEPSVYSDEFEVARMDNGRFFMLELEPGKHNFRSDDKQSGIDMIIEAGKDYYVRVEIATGFLKGHGRLVMTAPEQGQFEVKKLQPLGQDKIRDHSHVITDQSK
jgi:hypothetical protein